MFTELKLTNSQEEYLKTIYVLENAGKVRVTDIANKLRITKPSVNKAVKGLNELKLINYQTYGDISLTEKGKEVSKEIIKKQDILKTFFVHVLEVEEGQAEIEVSSMKHAVSEDTVDKLDKYISKIFKLDCDYDVNNKKCQNCIKNIARKNKDKII